MTPQQLVHPEDWERVEVIPAQTRFLVRIQFQNLQSWEMGLLLFSLGLTKSYTFDFKAGGAKELRYGCASASLAQRLCSIWNKLAA